MVCLLRRDQGYTSNVVKMNLNQRRCPASHNGISKQKPNNHSIQSLTLLTEYENGSDDEINDCSHEDVVSLLEDDYLGEENIFEDKLETSKINQSCLCFKIGTSSLTLVCTERKMENNLAEFRIDFKIEKLFRIRNYKNTYCYIIISKLVPYWLTQSMGTLIQGVLKTRLIKNEEESGVFLWARLVCSFQAVAPESNDPI